MVSENEFVKLEAALIRAGKSIDYPSTPPLSVRVRAELQTPSARRARTLPRLAWSIAIALIIALALLLAFPETRDALAQIFGLRTIRIIPTTPTATPVAPPTPSALTTLPTTTPASRAPTLTPSRTAQCCETTLDDVRARSRFKILLPPGTTPSRVYFQSLKNFGDAQQVILVFGDANNPRFTLYQATNFLYGKLVGGGTVIEETTVNGQRALWLAGAPHLLVYLDANGQVQFDSERTVSANTLAWESGEVTYRLETNGSKAEAIQFAESLR
jgi:hypothetical protein